MKSFHVAASTLFVACLAASAGIGPANAGPKPMLHGNYCGPGNNAPLPPVDALDEACARHDDCTPDGGLATKACNLRLQAEAERVAQDPGEPSDLRALAGVVASGAAMMPSAPAARSVVPVEGRPTGAMQAARPSSPDPDGITNEADDDAD
jgi:tRNA(fMet)-specific endonuclease VapC